MGSKLKFDGLLNFIPAHVPPHINKPGPNILEHQLSAHSRSVGLLLRLFVRISKDQ